MLVGISKGIQNNLIGVVPHAYNAGRVGGLIFGPKTYLVSSPGIRQVW